MSILGLVTAVIMFVVVLAYIGLPLLVREPATEGDFRSKQRERALAYYERVLRNIRDLDDDLATGKIQQVEYDFEREKWMSRGVELLHMIEELDQEHNINSTLASEANDAEIDQAIEQALSGIHDQQTVNGMS
ncbi:MAG: hypothetical protein AAF846_12065 [Chloroflexota bacterium]